PQNSLSSLLAQQHYARPTLAAEPHRYLAAVRVMHRVPHPYHPMLHIRSVFSEPPNFGRISFARPNYSDCLYGTAKRTYLRALESPAFLDIARPTLTSTAYRWPAAGSPENAVVRPHSYESPRC